MGIRYLNIKVRLKFEDDLTDQDRQDIADDIRNTIDSEARRNGLGTDFPLLDITTGAEWNAK